MILDTLAASVRYFRLHPGFPAAFAYLQSLSHIERVEGRRELDGERLFGGVACSDGRGREGAKLEAHRRYIDIQMCLTGQETIGWRPLPDLRRRNRRSTPSTTCNSSPIDPRFGSICGRDGLSSFIPRMPTRHSRA